MPRLGGVLSAAALLCAMSAALLAAPEVRQDAREDPAAIRARDHVFALLSHEIRTPLNGVLGMAGLLAATPLDATQAAYLATLRDCGEHLLGLVNNMLDLAKLEAGRVELEPVETDVEGLLRGVCELLSPRVHAQGLEIAWQVAPDTPAIWADDGALRQILFNLAGNAVKLTRLGGVLLDARPVAGAAEESGAPAVHRDRPPDRGCTPRIRRASSRSSPRPTPASVPAGRGWGWRSCAGSSPPWTARWGWTARPAPAPPSGSRRISTGPARRRRRGSSPACGWRSPPLPGWCGRRRRLRCAPAAAWRSRMTRPATCAWSTERPRSPPPPATPRPPWCCSRPSNATGSSLIAQRAMPAT